MSIQDEVEGLRKASRITDAEADRLHRLSVKYPDLKKYTGRWGKTAFYTRAVNPVVDKVDIRHNCGCCNDSPLEAWPYVMTEDGKVYSDPPMFFVGERHWSHGDVATPGWDEKIRSHGISDAVIEAIRPSFYEDEDGDG